MVAFEVLVGAIIEEKNISLGIVALFSSDDQCVSRVTNYLCGQNQMEDES